MIHTGNSYINKDNLLVIDATVYQNSSRNVYEVFDLENLRKQSDLLGHSWGNVWKRFEMNLETGEITTKDLINKNSLTMDYLEMQVLQNTDICITQIAASLMNARFTCIFTDAV